MRLSASSIHGLYRPSPCELRVYLRSKGVQDAKPNPYEEVLIELGQWHEKKHLASSGDHIDLSTGDEDRRARRTSGEAYNRAIVLYRSSLRIEAYDDDTNCVLVRDAEYSS